MTQNIITFKLKDNTAYTITYDVTGKMVSLGNTISPENISSLYDNTVTLAGANNESKASTASILSRTYTSSSTYTYEISISGKKMWSTAGTGYGNEILPHNIQVIIRRDTYDILDKLIESDYIVYDETVSSDADGNWTFKVTGLKNMETNGNRYDYKLEEVFVDGFTMSEVTKTGSGGKINLEWTNTFTAPSKEYGKVQVNKSWDDKNNAGSTRPDEITLYLKTADGKTTVDTKVIDIAGGDTSVMFEKVPLYDYSRDTSGNLVRTPRKYIIEEKAVAGYKSFTSSAFTLTDSTAADLVIDTPKVIDIINTLGSSNAQTTDISGTPEVPDGNSPSYTTTSSRPTTGIPVGTTAPVGGNNNPAVTTVSAGDNDEPVSTTASIGNDDEPVLTTAPADDEDEPAGTKSSDDSTEATKATESATASNKEETETDVDGAVVSGKTTSADPDDIQIDREENTTTTRPADDTPELNTDSYTDGSDSSAEFEENPSTGVSSKLVLLGAFALGACALFPRKKE